ncbi:hypothetical protein [Bacillus sp. OTU530]|uniref:hypothetical protein n=1 Tax=Bacillus sp. OTU530 TaxID=3043862 RepID=UPI00313DC642
MFRNSKSQSENAKIPLVCEVEGSKYEEYQLYDDHLKRGYFVIRNIPYDRGITRESISLYGKTKHNFSKFIEAKIDDRNFQNPIINEDADRNDYLILVDDKGNQLHLTGCTCGYSGEGPRGTLEILNKSGFAVNERFVFCAQSFALNHPTIEKNLYGERL